MCPVQFPPKPRPRTCSELGACQVRLDCQECGYPIGECQDVAGDGALCTRLLRDEQANPIPNEPPEHRHRNRGDWLWFLGPILLIALGLLIVHIVAWVRS